MPPALIGQTVGVQNSGTTLAVSQPGGTAANDLGLLIVNAAGGTGTTIGTPGGWTAFPVANSTTVIGTRIFRKIYTSDSEANISVTVTNVKMCYFLFVFRQVAAASSPSPIDASSSSANASSTSILSPSISVSVQDDIIIYNFAISGVTTISLPGTLTDLAGLGVQQTTATSAVSAICGYKYLLGVGGSTGAETATAGAAAVNIGYTAGLRFNPFPPLVGGIRPSTLVRL